MKQTFNCLASYILTPTALFANLAEWFGKLTINQTFTIIISSFVVVYWAFKARKEFLASQVEKRKLETMG